MLPRKREAETRARRRPKWADEGACCHALVDLNVKLFDLESKEYRRTSFKVRPVLGYDYPRGVGPRWRQRVAAGRASIDSQGHLDVRAER